jgi:hypothetical protein
VADQHFTLRAKATIGNPAGQTPRCTLTIAADGLVLERSKFFSGLLEADPRLVDPTRELRVYKPRRRISPDFAHMVIVDGKRFSVVSLYRRHFEELVENAPRCGLSVDVIQVPTSTQINGSRLVYHLQREGLLPWGLAAA